MAATTKKAQTAKRPAKKTAAKNVKNAAKKTVKKTVKKPAKKAARKTAAPKVNVGSVAHTEFASSDPAATKTWAKKTLGWKFGPTMPSPNGDYHMWNSATEDSGGIRNTMAPEGPGTIVYIEVANVKRAFEKALKNGATGMVPPMLIGPNMGSMAVVNAPGGVPIGLWGFK